MKRVVHRRYLSLATTEYHGQQPSKLDEEIANIEHASWVSKNHTFMTESNQKHDEQECQSPVIEESDSLWVA